MHNFLKKGHKKITCSNFIVKLNKEDPNTNHLYRFGSFKKLRILTDSDRQDYPVALSGLGDEAALGGGREAPDPGGAVVGQGRLQGGQAPAARSHCTYKGMDPDPS